MQVGGSFPETMVPILCMQSASLSRSDESLALAREQGSLGIAAVAGRTRRLFGPTCGSVRQDVLVAMGVDAHSSDGDFDAQVVYRQRK